MIFTELIGTITFAISGAALAIKKDFDIFGIVMMAVITAVGGGVIRDVIFGISPPAVFSNPIYCITAIISAALPCIPIARKALNNKRLGAVVMLVMDSVGLAVFTINAIVYSSQIYPDNEFLLVFTGAVTGVGGGVMRDILAGELPYIFKKHIYASASIIGAILFVFIKSLIPETVAIYICVLLIISIRILSAYFKLELPHIKE